MYIYGMYYISLLSPLHYSFPLAISAVSGSLSTPSAPSPHRCILLSGLEEPFPTLLPARPSHVPVLQSEIPPCLERKNYLLHPLNHW
jgi:hypothetical protein